jgi:hypothetical protein
MSLHNPFHGTAESMAMIKELINCLGVRSSAVFVWEQGLVGEPQNYGEELSHSRGSTIFEVDTPMH